MNYGLYLSSSGALAASYRQDVAANNLANVNTVGFKPDLTLAMARQPERQEGHMGRALANDLLERLGGGVINGPQHLNVRGGSPVPTGNPLDAALLQNDTFLHVRVPDPETGGFEDRLTRDGRMLVGADGEAVEARSAERSPRARGRCRAGRRARRRRARGRRRRGRAGRRRGCGARRTRPPAGPPRASGRA